jgi:DNA-directed RNA polymerase specialized sigma subunit
LLVQIGPALLLAAFRIDFAQWMKRLHRRDRRIIAAFVSGERTWSVAERFGISEGRVSQLRRKYEREWRVFQGQGGLENAA